MTTMTDIPTARAFGACMMKGCRHKTVTELPALGGRPVVYAEGVGYVDAATDGGISTRAMRAAGLVCPTHGAEMIFRLVQATYNPAKICNGRCMSAKTASCDCSCNGANHGSTF